MRALIIRLFFFKYVWVIKHIHGLPLILHQYGVCAMCSYLFLITITPVISEKPLPSNDTNAEVSIAE